MKYSTSHTQVRLLVLAAVIGMTAAALLTMASYAGAESAPGSTVASAILEPVAESSPAVESPAPEEPPPGPEPTSPAPVQTGAASIDTAPAELQEPVSNATSQVSQVAKNSAAPKIIDETSRAREVIETVSHNAVEATARVVESAGASAPIAEAGKAAGHVLNSAERSLGSAEDSLRSPVDALRQVGSNVLEVGKAAAEAQVGSSSRPPIASPPGPSGSLLGDATSHERIGALSGSPLPYVAGSGGIEPLKLWAPIADAASVAQIRPMPMGSVGVALLFSGGGGAWENRSAPLDGNGPSQPPQTSPTAASGLGGSSFVPIAALLALLALVAPAIVRRLQEMADFSPPIPFACALERPG